MIADGFTDIGRYIDLLKYGAIAELVSVVAILIGGLHVLVKIRRLESQLDMIREQLAEMTKREKPRDRWLELMMEEIRK